VIRQSGAFSTDKSCHPCWAGASPGGAAINVKVRKPATIFGCGAAPRPAQRPNPVPPARRVACSSCSFCTSSALMGGRSGHPALGQHRGWPAQARDRNGLRPGPAVTARSPRPMRETCRSAAGQGDAGGTWQRAAADAGRSRPGSSLRESGPRSLHIHSVDSLAPAGSRRRVSVLRPAGAQTLRRPGGAVDDDGAAVGAGSPSPPLHGA
jgi:hypothetical protein